MDCCKSKWTHPSPSNGKLSSILGASLGQLVPGGIISRIFCLIVSIAINDLRPNHSFILKSFDKIGLESENSMRTKPTHLSYQWWSSRWVFAAWIGQRIAFRLCLDLWTNACGDLFVGSLPFLFSLLSPIVYGQNDYLQRCPSYGGCGTVDRCVFESKKRFRFLAIFPLQKSKFFRRTSLERAKTL